MSVKWSNCLTVNKKKHIEIDDRHKLWTDLIKPKCIDDLIGNKSQLKEVNDWFVDVQMDTSESSRCLFVHGNSGVGKSTSVSLIAKKNGFTPLETYANIQRTPQKMESLYRELSIIGDQSVLILDDTESFLKETSVVKTFTKMFKNKEKKNGRRIICVIICNSVDKSLNTLKDCCESVEFENLNPNDINIIFRNLSRKVMKFCYIPPMASFLVSSKTSGNITQAVTQMQFLYQNTPFPVIKRNKNTNKRLKLDQSSKNDTSFQMWVTTYKQSNINCFIGEDNLLDSISKMNKSFLDNLSNNLFNEYLNYFQNSTVETMNSISKCTEYLSLSDINKVEFHEDRLYESENINRYSEDEIGFIVGIYGGLSKLSGRKKNTWQSKKPRRTRMKFEYP